MMLALVTWACSGDEEVSGSVVVPQKPPEVPKATATIDQLPSVTATVQKQEAEPTVEATATITAPPEPKLPTPTPTPAPTPEARRDLAMFNFGEDVPENLRAEIRSGVNIGVSWLAEKTGVDLKGVSVFAFGSSDRLAEEYFKRKGGDSRSLEQIRRDLVHATAFAGSQKDFYINTTSPGWTTASPIVGGPVVEGRYHTIFHELFHVLQYEVRGYSLPPLGWLNEGGAHYIAARALDENGIYSYEDIKRRHLSRAGFAGDSLQGLEDQSKFANADTYSLSFLALDFLTKGMADNGVGALAAYWREIGRGSGPDAAMLIAFGKNRAEFYKEFEEYRARGFQ